MDKSRKTAGKARRLKKGERTREKILQAAENTFAKSGFERATLREVAKAAGIHQPGIYNYFKTKRDLYEAVLKRMMHPMLAVLDEIASLPPTDQGHQENKLVDLLVANRNIPSLLVRAFLSTNKTEKDLAVNWVKRFMAHTPPRSRRRRHEGARSLDDEVKDMAILNAWLGYFWAAPIIEWRTGKRITDTALIKSQKALLVFMTETL